MTPLQGISQTTLTLPLTPPSGDLMNSPTWGFLTIVSWDTLRERERDVEIFLGSFLHKVLYETCALGSFKTLKDQHYLSWLLESGCCFSDCDMTQTLGHMGPQLYSDYVRFTESSFQRGFPSKEISVHASLAVWCVVAE